MRRKHLLGTHSSIVFKSGKLTTEDPYAENQLVSLPKLREDTTTLYGDDTRLYLYCMDQGCGGTMYEYVYK